MLIRSFFRRITKDFRHKELLPLKLIFFVQASTLYVLYPYLTIHMRELGINVEETAIMSAITPFVAIVMPPLAGLVADRIGNFKILLSCFSSLGGAAALLLLLVPIGRVTVKYPEHIIMDLSCSNENNSDIIFTMNQIDFNCENNIQDIVTTKIESCGYICPIDYLQTTADLESLLSSKTYTVKYFDVSLNHNYSFKYNRPMADIMQTKMTQNEIKESRALRNNEYYKTAIRQLSKNTLFFPTGSLYLFSCILNNSSNVQRSFQSDEINANQNHSKFQTICKFDDIAFSSEIYNTQMPIKYLPFKIKMKILNTTEENIIEETRKYSSEKIMLSNNNEYHSLKCENNQESKTKISITIQTINSTSLNIDGCTKRCIATAPREQMCSNMVTVIEYNVQLTFWLYLGIRVFIGIIGGTAFAMFEGAVIAILREQKADYGLQRIYGAIGGMISSPLSGLLIDYASRNKQYTDFRPAFYLYAALKMASGVLMLTINLEFKSPAHNVIGDVISVLKNIEIVALLLACFVLGTAWGYIESFLFWLIQDLGGSRSLMGITITVGGIAGIPLLVLSGPIINKIGHPNVLFIGFVFYAVRLFGYSLIYNPWLCLIFEALESVTASLSFTAAVTYAAKLSTTTTDSSIQGLLGGLYYGVGKGSGSLIGGFLMNGFGTRPTYQIFAVVCLIFGIVYFLFNIMYLKKRPQVEGNDIVKKKPKDKPLDNGINNINNDKFTINSDPINSSINKNINTITEKMKIETNKELYVLNGEDNLGFDKELTVETLHNVKGKDNNLDSIEQMPEVKEKLAKLKISNVNTLNETDKHDTSTIDDGCSIGVMDPTFENKTCGECSITVEREPTTRQEVNENH
ncbi:hypothetical protein PV328_005551 [Microctonus aethiopoides]|uniref:Major facilitator superfamily associated domain-containing protein n=1 Tax=Microctonus aethiopoides TaxID=144406 RepID=A0AA39FMY0_9HYME|nr:hypothetical protein PV328_005551 [Microctonus aethiopoides]